MSQTIYRIRNAQIIKEKPWKIAELYIIYFLLRFGFANAIHDYSRLKIRVVGGRNFNLKCLLIEFVITNLGQI